MALWGLSPQSSIQLVVLVCSILAVLVAGSYSQCPSGSVLHPGVGLCYWELTSLHNTSTAQRECQRQGGDLALVPLPAVEKFLIEHFDLSQFYADNNVTRVTWLVGYHVNQSDIVSLTEPYLPLAWTPSLYWNASQDGYCFRIQRKTTTTLAWYHDSCSVMRRFLCSSWAGEVSALWRGEAGRLGGHTLATSNQLTLSRCATSCHLRQGCASFNFQRSSGTCELVSKVKAYPKVNVTSDPGFMHYERRL